MPTVITVAVGSAFLCPAPQTPYINQPLLLLCCSVSYITHFLRSFRGSEVHCISLLSAIHRTFKLVTSVSVEWKFKRTYGLCTCPSDFKSILAVVISYVFIKMHYHGCCLIKPTHELSCSRFSLHNPAPPRFFAVQTDVTQPHSLLTFDSAASF